jgi:hypothetical protein
VILHIVKHFLVLLWVYSLAPLFVDIAPIVLDAAGYCWHHKVCIHDLALSTWGILLTLKGQCKYFLSTHRDTCADFFILPYVLNDILDKQRIYLVIDVSLPHRVPNLPALNDFECPLILQWLHGAQFISALAFVARHLHTTHVIEQCVNNWLMKTLVCEITGNDLLGSPLMLGGHEKVVSNY